jgi:hypothetical protein
MMRFAQRLTEYFNIRVKALISMGNTNIIDMTNNNSGVALIDPVFSSKDFNATESLKRYVSPFKELNTSATHNTARIILTSSRFLAVPLFVPRGLALIVFIFVSFFERYGWISLNWT